MFEIKASRYGWRNESDERTASIVNTKHAFLWRHLAQSRTCICPSAPCMVVESGRVHTRQVRLTSRWIKIKGAGIALFGRGTLATIRWRACNVSKYSGLLVFNSLSWETAASAVARKTYDISALSHSYLNTAC